MRTSFFLPVALSSILLTGTAAAQQPPAAAAPPAAALPPGYYPPPPAHAQPYGQQPHGVPPLRATQRFSTPMMTTGLVLTSLGALVLAAGTLAWVTKEGVVCDTGSCGGHGADTVVMVAGAVATLAGIPLIVLGARRVPVKQEESALVPAISVSPRGASLTFTF